MIIGGAKGKAQGESESVHEPVLLHEVVEAFAGAKRKAQGASESQDANALWYLDGTLGGAGHTRAMLKTFETRGEILNIIGLDQDPEAIERARKIFSAITSTAKSGTVILENENFRNLDKVLDKHGIDKVDMILLDLGISSDELENSGRGFTFQKDEPLFMTMGDPAQHPFTAKDIVNGWKEEDIANVIFAYGEDRFSRRIAKAIVRYREKKSIETSMELAEIVKSAVPFISRGFGGKSKIHPATKTFQALRIAVNDELKALEEGLMKGFERLAPGGRMAVISFHSLEDRIVKNYFKDVAGKSATILTKKPVTAIDQEIAENPRSRSAKLRVIEKNI
ncbi:MAG: 16S rRNA (cytosine(1402)-N(4))-methyltransferase RsmH [Candidatus Taylorbacteria bacterium]